MRVMLAVLVLVGVFVFGSSAAIDSVPVLDSAVTTVLAQQPSGQLDVNVDVGEGGGAWWSNPLWIAIGVVALVLVIVLLAMAFRGGGTTVIKE